MPSSKKLQSNKDYDLFINNLESMLSNINNEKDINKNYINIENIVLFLSRECFNIDAKDYDFLNDEKSSKKTAQA
ncbi:MAG: hypothetical protein QM532_03225 [Cyanobium sp. MAG06]|nr:hypothetical protein [Cyanobium sp. MAG06]